MWGSWFAAHESINTYFQTDICGFAEAVVSFTSSFDDPLLPMTSCSSQSGPYSYRYVNSANSREVVLVVEEGNFIIGCSLNRKKCKACEYFPHSPTLRTVMIRVYESFRLLYGPLLGQHGSMTTDEFRALLNRFFTPYLATLRLSKVELGELDTQCYLDSLSRNTVQIPLVDLFPGVDFMPLTSGTDYLEVECLMTRLVEEFPAIKHTAFLYQQRLIQYTVEKTDLIPLFQFLTDRLIAYSLQLELQPEFSSKRVSVSENRPGTFVRGMGEEDDYWGELTRADFPRIYLHDVKSGLYRPYEMVSGGITSLCWQRRLILNSPSPIADSLPRPQRHSVYVHRGGPGLGPRPR